MHGFDMKCLGVGIFIKRLHMSSDLLLVLLYFRISDNQFYPFYKFNPN